MINGKEKIIPNNIKKSNSEEESKTENKVAEAVKQTVNAEKEEVNVVQDIVNEKKEEQERNLKNI